MRARDETQSTTKQISDFLNDNDETCTFRKDVRGNRTRENVYQMPDEDRSSHRFFAFAQIVEKKRVLFPLFRQIVYCRFFFLFAQKTATLQTLTFSLYWVRGKIGVRDGTALNSRSFKISKTIKALMT